MSMTEMDLSPVGVMTPFAQLVCCTQTFLEIQIKIKLFPESCSLVRCILSVSTIVATNVGMPRWPKLCEHNLVLFLEQKLQ